MSHARLALRLLDESYPPSPTCRAFNAPLRLPSGDATLAPVRGLLSPCAGRKVCISHVPRSSFEEGPSPHDNNTETCAPGHSQAEGWAPGGYRPASLTRPSADESFLPRSSADESFPPCTMTEVSRPGTLCSLFPGSLQASADESFPPRTVPEVSRPAPLCPLVPSPTEDSSCICNPWRASPQAELPPFALPIGPGSSPALDLPSIPDCSLPPSSGTRGDQNEPFDASEELTPSSRDGVAVALMDIFSRGPFDFVSFDVVRGPVVYRLPHGQGPAEAVRHALQHAPFPDPAWTHTRVHVPGYPCFQILIMRRHAQVTVVIDTRPLEGEIFVVEATADPVSGQQFASQAPLHGRSPFVAQLLRASSLAIFYNHRPWVPAYVLRFTNGDLVCFAGRSGSLLQPGPHGLRWNPSAASSDRHSPPLLVARVGATGAACGIGVAPRPHLLLALARALRDLLQGIPDLSRHFLVASPLQDAAFPTYQEVRFLAVRRSDGEMPTAWLDRRLVGGGLSHLQVPCLLHAEDLPALATDLMIDLSVLRDVAAVTTGSTLQQIPSAHHGGGLIPVAALFHLEGMRALAAGRYSPQLRLSATLGPDWETADALREWLSTPSIPFSPDAEGSRVCILAPGSTLTVVVSLIPPTLQQLNNQVSDWLLLHYGPGTLYDCAMAAGDVCLFVYMPDQVSNLFAGAVQIVRAHPFFRLVSRGALHRTPADRLRFLTFDTDAACTLSIPSAVAASDSSSGVGEGAGGSNGAEEEVSEGHSLLQLRASLQRAKVLPVPLSEDRNVGQGDGRGMPYPLSDQLRALPSPLRMRSDRILPSPSLTSSTGKCESESGPAQPPDGPPSDSGMQAASLTHVVRLSESLEPSSELRLCSSLVHAIAVWGSEIWVPISRVHLPCWIQALLPNCHEDFAGQAPSAFHVFTDGLSKRGKAGWGVVLAAEFGGPDRLRFLAVAGRGILPIAGAASFSATTNNAAEAWALLMAQLAAFALPAHLPLTFWVDSQVTIGSAQGTAEPASIQGDAALSEAVRATALLLQQRPAALQWIWVPGHSRVGGNELADYIAGLAARGAFASPLPQTVCSLLRHPLLPWAWRMVSGQSGLPTLEKLIAGRYEQPDRLPVCCVQAIAEDAQTPAPRAHNAIALRLLTANLCTGAGKHAALTLQLDAAKVDVAFFQETRARVSSQRVGRWFRFCAAAKGGHGGCSIWISGAWMVGDRAIRVTDCTVLIARHDFLAVRVKLEGCSLLFVNVHGPHSQHEAQWILSWWQEVHAAVRSLLDGDQLILGGDLNARIGPCDNCSGTHGPDITDLAGECATNLCLDLGLVLANTFVAVMQDHVSFTWRDRRLDYLAVPSGCLGSCQVVNAEFDLLNPHEDHRALCLDLTAWVRDASRLVASAAPARRASSHRILAGRSEFEARQVLCQLAQRSHPWETNVHLHAEAIFSGAQALLDGASQVRAWTNKPFTSYLTMSFIQQRKQCDRTLLHLDRQEQLALLAKVFGVWKGRGSGDLPAPDPPPSVRIGKAACLQARLIWCRCVRRQLRLDKAEYVEQLCRELHDAASRKDCAALFIALRYFRPASKRVFKPFGPLSVLRGPDGVAAGSFDEQQALRGRHFGAMEAAIEQTAAEFAAHDLPPEVPDTAYSLHHLPSVLDVERAIRSLPSRKATGPSGVPNEVWKASPALAAGVWLPVMVKQNVRLTEPVRFSTGVLVTLFKGKGDPSDVAAHRSIFLLEGVGKACRKMIRLPLLRALHGASPDLFEGCQPRSSAEVLSHYVTSFRDLHALRGWSTVCLFLDLSSAY